MEVPKKQRNVSPLAILLGIAIVAAAAYALYLLGSLTGELRRMSAKLDGLDDLHTVAADIHSLSARLSMLEETNDRLARVEGYLRYVPQIAQTGNAALAQSAAAGSKLDATNAGLAQANAILSATMAKLDESSRGLSLMHSELLAMRGSLDAVAANAPALAEMRDQLTRSSDSLEQATAGINNVCSGMQDMSAGLADMQAILRDSNEQMAVLPELRDDLRQMNEAAAGAAAVMQPLAQNLPVLTASIEEMTRTSREMNQTTQEMAKDMNRMSRRGGLGVAILSAIGLAH